MPGRPGPGVGAALLDLLFPRRCAACGEAPRGGEPFCAVCGDAVDAVPPGCRRCGLPGPGSVGECPACLGDAPGFSGVSAAALFGGPVADAIRAFKYGNRPAVAGALGAWMATRVEAPRDAVVVAVPLGTRRLRERGYDQAALLAGGFARAARLPRLPWALRRVRETAPQVGLGRAERAANVRGAFAARPGVSGRDVLLLDDVVTTGATADAAARALREAGARSVRVVALARAE